jgi:hypothetical protein
MSEIALNAAHQTAKSSCSGSSSTNRGNRRWQALLIMRYGEINDFF